MAYLYDIANSFAIAPYNGSTKHCYLSLPQNLFGTTNAHWGKYPLFALDE
jgi:hypothetical protein